MGSVLDCAIRVQVNPGSFPPLSTFSLEIQAQHTPLQPPIFVQFDVLIKKACLARNPLDDRIGVQEILFQDSARVERSCDALGSSAPSTKMALDFRISRECAYLDGPLGILENPSARGNYGWAQINGDSGRECRGSTIRMEMYPALPAHASAEPRIGLQLPDEEARFTRAAAFKPWIRDLSSKEEPGSKEEDAITGEAKEAATDDRWVDAKFHGMTLPTKI